MLSKQVKTVVLIQNGIKIFLDPLHGLVNQFYFFRYTPALGPGFEGCPCYTYQFGCCPDGKRFAKGPRQQGCGCSESEFGCCTDGQTAATGPNSEGCDCGASKYGCCPDGAAEATGEDFEGCADKPPNLQCNCL